MQWYTQRLLRTAVQSAQAKSGAAVVLDSRTGELLALADYPTYDPNEPAKATKGDLGSRALRTSTSPGRWRRCSPSPRWSTPARSPRTTKFVVPGELPVLDRTIRDWFNHDTLH